MARATHASHWKAPPPPLPPPPQSDWLPAVKAACCPMQLQLLLFPLLPAVRSLPDAVGSAIKLPQLLLLLLSAFLSFTNFWRAVTVSAWTFSHLLTPRAWPSRWARCLLTPPLKVWSQLTHCTSGFGPGLPFFPEGSGAISMKFCRIRANSSMGGQPERSQERVQAGARQKEASQSPFGLQAAAILVT